jgi:hypothetical protein
LTHRAAITAALAVVAVLAPGAAADAASDGPPEGAGITRITANGTGCAPDSVTSTWSDATGFRVYYGQLVARAGGGAPGTDARKSCTISVQLAIPFGYTVALQSASTRKYATLAPGARVTAQTKTYWQGSASTLSWSEQRRGPQDGDWQSTYAIDPASQLYASCGESRLLNISQDLFVLRGTDPAIENSAEFDREAGVNAGYQLVWKRCLF